MDLVHPEDLGSVQDFMIRILTWRNKPGYTLLRIRHKEGGYVWFESVIHAIRDPVTGNVREFIMSRVTLLPECRQKMSGIR